MSLHRLAQHHARPYDRSMFAMLSPKRFQVPSAEALAHAQARAERPRHPPTAWAEPLPLPEVVEDDSDAAWALWQAAVRDQSSRDADTVLMDLMPV